MSPEAINIGWITKHTQRTHKKYLKEKEGRDGWRIWKAIAELGTEIIIMNGRAIKFGGCLREGGQCAAGG